MGEAAHQADTRVAAVGTLLVAVSLLAAGRASLPTNSGRTATTALQETDDTRLGQTLAPAVALHAGESGVVLLSRGPDALAARLTLAEHVLAAADRGVRVRVLPDELGSSAKHESLLGLDSHPTIEVRLYNPLTLRGARVILMTNSLASADTVPAHAGYGRYRKELLRMGVELYELKPSANATHTASLHAKGFAFDQRVLFIGSFNLDLSSANWNTEMGVVFESPEPTKPMLERLEAKLGESAWRVELVPGPEHSTRLNWVSNAGRETVEPECSFGRRFMVAVIGWLPVEGQL
ncbi:MAG TPA: phospholipase D-like domain-containing protein [Verrucomicrobiae bacterium]|nr:phospholipase D-like domain-containing protein [Verrucomicrobiae bacterium]